MLKLDIWKFINTFKTDSQIYFVAAVCLAFLGCMVDYLKVSMYLTGICLVLAVTSLILGFVLMFFHVMLLNCFTEKTDFIESSSFLKGFKFGNCVIHNNRIIFYSKTDKKKKLFSLKSSVIEHALCVSTH